MHPVRFLLGLAFILSGIMIFLSNLGYLSWHAMVNLLDYWPLGLIIIGISFLWGGEIPRWLALLIAFLMSALVVLLSLQYPYGRLI